MTESAIVDSVKKAFQTIGDEKMTADIVPVMTHTQGLGALDAALRNVEQQPEAKLT